MNTTSRRIALLLGMLMLGLWYVGQWHFIYGSNVSLYTVKKISWSLSETVINKDEVSMLPAIAARIKYPLLIQSLQSEKE